MHDQSSERRATLNGVKLRALSGASAEAVAFGSGAALVDGDRAWVLADDQPERRLGAALAWALRHGAARLDLVAERGTGTLARRAGEFDFPIQVWHAADRDLIQAVPEPVAEVVELPAHHEPFRELIAAGGARPLVESGVLVGEVAGLEVCRVVDDADLGTTRLEVGVGAHDREAFQMLHGDVPAAESLARIVAVVAEHRRPGAPPHPLNRLAAERLLRSRLEADPGLVGADRLTAAEPPVPRPNLKDPVPCVAAGVSASGDPLVVVCSSGVDLDLIPYAADARLAYSGRQPGVGEGGRVELVVVTPRRDRIEVVERLAGLLSGGVRLAALDLPPAGA